MKKLFGVLFLIFVLVFSGCSSGGSGFSLFGSTSKTPEVDRTGDGLKVTFNINEELISIGQLRYELTFENTGIEPVILTKENFQLKTDVKMQDGSSVLDQKSLDDFYKTVFRDGEILTIYHDQKISSLTGPLFIKDEFLKKKTQEKFEYVLLVKYDYKTKFANNLEIDLRNVIPLKVLDSMGQAAPIQVKDIKLERLPENNYIIKYFLVDKGQSSDTDKSIKLKNINIKFRTQDLSGCKGLVFKDGIYKDLGIDSLIINKETPEVIVGCKVNMDGIEKDSKMTTTTSGSFEYGYSIIIKKTIQLPVKSGDQIVWN